jgi:hypothetical protein
LGAGSPLPGAARVTGGARGSGDRCGAAAARPLTGSQWLQGRGEMRTTLFVVLGLSADNHKRWRGCASAGAPALAGGAGGALVHATRMHGAAARRRSGGQCQATSTLEGCTARGSDPRAIRAQAWQHAPRTKWTRRVPHPVLIGHHPYSTLVPSAPRPGSTPSMDGFDAGSRRHAPAAPGRARGGHRRAHVAAQAPPRKPRTHQPSAHAPQPLAAQPSGAVH